MLKLIILPVVGAFIGWVTNWLAVVLIFRPHRPWRIPVVGLVVQGLVPKRKNELARAIGDVVERDLLPADQVLERLTGEKARDEVVAAIGESVERRVLERLPPYLPRGISAGLSAYLGELSRREAAHFLEQSRDKLLAKTREALDFRRIVEDRIDSFSLVEMERLVLRIASRELQHIVWLGAVLGFLVGLIQALVLMALGQ